MTEELHSPTTAGPTPDAGATSVSRATPAATVAAADAAPDRPAGTAAGEGTELPFGIPSDKPEILVGAAFAGGVLAAIILKRLGGG